MSLANIVYKWKQSAKPLKATLAKELLSEIGFQATSENNGIHWKVREVDYSIDLWPTTERLQIIGSDGIKESVVGFENIVVRLVRLIIRRNNEN